VTPAIWTLADWMWACTKLGVIGTFGQWTWNVMLHPMLADLFDWDDIDSREQIPPLFWAGAAVMIFIAVALLFVKEHPMKNFWKHLMEYRYWRRRGYSCARAWETARNTI